MRTDMYGGLFLLFLWCGFILISCCFLWNNITSYDCILRDMNLHCALWNDFASYKLILSLIISYCAIWSNIAFYGIILRLMIHTAQYNAILYLIKDLKVDGYQSNLYVMLKQLLFSL